MLTNFLKKIKNQFGFLNLNKYKALRQTHNYSNDIIKLCKNKPNLFLPTNMKSSPSGFTKLFINSLPNIDIFYNEGLRIIYAFTNEERLIAWAGKNIEFAEWETQKLLIGGELARISIIIIDEGTEDVLHIKRDNSYLQKPNNTDWATCTFHPLNNEEILQELRLLIDYLGREHIVEELFTYLKTDMDETCVEIAVSLSNNSDDAILAFEYAIMDALEKVDLKFMIDFVFIENIEVYEYIKNIENSLVYKKCPQILHN